MKCMLPCALALTLAAASASAGRAAEPAPASSAGAGAVEARIDTARWESGYGERFFQVVGTVSNRSSRPVAAVRLRCELLDEAGAVVASFDGWNGRAEALGELRGAAAQAQLAKLAPQAIALGATDRFRATFLADETPKFASQRVQVVEVLPAPEVK
ncbi:MAG: FxLYD domain-containing protein [Thermodesulfobacteriota bacterium]